MRDSRSRSLIRSFILLLLGMLTLSCQADITGLDVQRELFLEAERSLSRNEQTTFKQLRKRLESYPLVDYLDYQELSRRLDDFPTAEADAFLARHQGSYIGRSLGRRWLLALARDERWQDYLHYFEELQLRGAELRCYYLHARLLQGDTSALDEVAPLWNVSYSQANACDPVFQVWMDNGYLSDELAWERHSKAVAAGNFSLARYIRSTMSAEYRKLAELYLKVHRQPEYLAKVVGKLEASKPGHEIILHGIRRYALKDPLAAAQLWERFDASHFFASEARDRVQEYLITHLVVEGHRQPAERLLQERETIVDSELIAWLVRDALRTENWERVYSSIQLFQADQQEEKRWLYWRARALEKLDRDDPRYGSAKEIYARLAGSRSYHGFLAASILGHDYNLAHRPVDLPPELLQEVEALPALQRARELFILGREYQARQEWADATRGMEAAQLLAAGRVAQNWGWYYKGIQAAINARYWDDLQLRFPLAYAGELSSAAASTRIDAPLLYAITRQESAFSSHARSPAGAMGLMQLMPGTAKRTARRIGLSYHDLVNPRHNIQLGSHYLQQLLQEFDGNLVLATAAYNAGPHRVREWLNNDGKALPYDIWIETIPYRETRGYVQNVLSFSVIYAQRMGKQWPLLQIAGEIGEEQQASGLVLKSESKDAS